MKFKFIIFSITIALITSCAVVPKESVELSATVGRDIVSAYHSHKELANILFARMKKDVNTFVDEVYAPYQIGLILEADLADSNSGLEDSMTGAIMAAANNSKDSKKQKEAFLKMNKVVFYIHNEVESFRKKMLKNIKDQEKEVLGAIDRSYNQIIYANSIVTGHLASIRKVHDVQEEILNEFGLDDMRSKTSQKLSEYSVGMDKILNDIKKVDIDKIGSEFKGVQEKINKLFKK
mgnify:FL=1